MNQYFLTSYFDYFSILGFEISVSSVLRIDEDTSIRTILQGGSTNGQVYLVFLNIENDLGKRLTVSWSMIVKNLDGKVLQAMSLEATSKRKNWSRGTTVPRIDDEKEIKVTIVIKSLIKH